MLNSKRKKLQKVQKNLQATELMNKVNFNQRVGLVQILSMEIN